MSTSWRAALSVSLLLTPWLAAFCAGEARTGARSGFEFRDGAIIRGAKDDQRIALVFTGHTFAEGGATILAELARHRAKASFFLTGDFLSNTNFSPLVREIISGGHYLGPHSDQHLLYCSWESPPRTLVTREEFLRDLNRNVDKLAALGVPRGQVRFFLPAFEHYNREVADWTRSAGFTLVNYTPGTRAAADYTGEADRNFVPASAIFDSIVAESARAPAGLNGFILLMHIGAGPGRADKFHARFGALLDYLADHHYRFVRIDELLTEGTTQ